MRHYSTYSLISNFGSDGPWWNIDPILAAAEGGDIHFPPAIGTYKHLGHSIDSNLWTDVDTQGHINQFLLSNPKEGITGFNDPRHPSQILPVTSCDQCSVMKTNICSYPLTQFLVQQKWNNLLVRSTNIQYINLVVMTFYNLFP